MPEAVELVCIGGAARGLPGLESWLCARCLGMSLGALVGALAFQRWRPGKAIVILLAMAALNLAQHGLAVGGGGTGLDAGVVRLLLGAGFGVGWSAVISSRLTAVASRRVWGATGLATLIWLGMGAALEADRVRGFAELASYVFMASSLGLAASEQLRARMRTHATSA